MLKEIDWEEQWAIHAPDFHDGCAHIVLPTNQKIQLLPGPGFGDFSHPTTRLMIELMSSYVPGKNILDIGCGSGILSIASAKMGGTRIYCSDIDPAAIEHTKKNAAFNHMSISTNLEGLKKPVVLMNMIFSEQIIAWQTHRLHFDKLMTSGILSSQREAYLAFATSQNWELMEEKESNEWLGFIFKEIL